MWMKDRTKTTMEQDFDINALIAAEEELHMLKEQYGIKEKEPFWKKAVDGYFCKKEARKPVEISKKKYCFTALFLGWLGVHCFMVGKKGQGIFYLLTSFTGISFALSVMDIWYAAFLKTDASQLIQI